MLVDILVVVAIVVVGNLHKLQPQHTLIVDIDNLLLHQQQKLRVVVVAWVDNNIHRTDLLPLVQQQHEHNHRRLPVDIHLRSTPQPTVALSYYRIYRIVVVVALRQRRAYNTDLWWREHNVVLRPHCCNRNLRCCNIRHHLHLSVCCHDFYFLVVAVVVDEHDIEVHPDRVPKGYHLVPQPSATPNLPDVFVDPTIPSPSFLSILQSRLNTFVAIRIPYQYILFYRHWKRPSTFAPALAKSPRCSWWRSGF
mmetsp:Transcript_32724/g.48459  ORF Transcript_32724/g.48459 Transcript_32724/m.48459 type:complete len:251 (-) Transcript_32724:455-1207(-)